MSKVLFLGGGLFAGGPTEPPATVTGANNGTSISGTDVQLGQAVGAPGNPASLLNHREIPTGGFAMSFVNGTSATSFDGLNIAMVCDATANTATLFLIDTNDPGGHFWQIFVDNFDRYISSWANSRGNLLYVENPTTSTGEVLISSSQAATPVNAKLLIEELSSSGFAIDYEILRLFSTVQFDTTAAARTSYGVRSVIASTRVAGANNLTNIAGYFNSTGAQNNYGVIVAGTALSGFLVPSPLAVLHIGQGTAARPGLILDSGVVATTPVSGAIENNGVNLFFTPSVTRLLVGLFSGASLVVGRVLFGDTSNMINQNANFVYSSANNCMGLGSGTTSAGTYLLYAANSTTKSAYRYTSGSLVTAPANGDKEYDGTNEYLTAGGVRYTLAKTLTNTAVLDFPNTAAQTSSDLTITVTGAADGDAVYIGVPNAAVNADSCYTAFVSAANTVTVRFNNYSAAAIDPASGTFRAVVTKY